MFFKYFLIPGAIFSLAITPLMSSAEQQVSVAICQQLSVIGTVVSSSNQFLCKRTRRDWCEWVSDQPSGDSRNKCSSSYQCGVGDKVYASNSGGDGAVMSNSLAAYCTTWLTNKGYNIGDSICVVSGEKRKLWCKNLGM